MKPLKYTMAALAVIAVASFTQSAMAQANVGDLVLGVYDTSGGSTVSFELDLGAFCSLSNGKTWTLGTAVSGLYSTDSTASLQWDISGTGGSTGGGGLGTKVVALTAETFTPVSGQNANEIQAIETLDSNYGESDSTALSDGFSKPNANTGSFATEYALNNGGYGYDTAAADTYPSTDSVTFYTVANKLSGAPTGVADGTFTLSDNGDILTYNTAAVPEPSAYALGLCALALFWVLKRRNSVA